MSSFETFVQLELPKRPFLEADVNQESVIVRRGPGIRQLDAVAMSEGQVLALVNGVLTGSSVSAISGFKKIVLQVPIASMIWNVAHNLLSTNAIIQVTDSSGAVILADEMRIVDSNTIVISFGTPQAGIVRILFLD